MNTKSRQAKYRIGQVVRHRMFPFRGVIFDIDPTFNNTEEWYLSIPEEIRPTKDQPFYHLLAENAESEYIAYVSEQNLLPDTSGEPLRHPELEERFYPDGKGAYRARDRQVH
ncbi:MAG TPA: heat shock protein HspQ [Xanthobacteraceae bacterium]|nr:heat shock protein HspQ [Xanthobacteraceae bacterium]